MMSVTSTRTGKSTIILLGLSLLYLSGCGSITQKTSPDAASADKATSNESEGVWPVVEKAGRYPGNDGRLDGYPVYSKPASVASSHDSLSRRLRHHVWDVLSIRASESCGFALYTYVIFTRSVEDLDELQESVKQRYLKLLSAITVSTPNRRDAPAYYSAETNIFYIPTKSEYEAGASRLSRYDTSLSRQIGSQLRVMLRSSADTDGIDLVDMLSLSPGPFLVSTLIPIRKECYSNDGLQDAANSGILFVDLSGQHPDAMAEIVRAYKRYTRDNEAEGVERFASIRLELLTMILNADESIRLIKAATAELFEH